MENLILNIISISIAVPITVYWYIKDSKKAKKEENNENKYTN